MKTKSIIYCTLPFLICLLFGGGLLILSFYVNESYKSFFQNLSSSFIIIPLLFYSYEKVKSFSEKKLKQELFDYAKIQVDTEVLSIIRIFHKIFFSYERETSTLDNMERMLHVNNDAIKKYLLENEFLGFQLFKSWDFPMIKIQKIIENHYILSRLTDSQVLALIHLHQSLNDWLAFYQKMRDSEVFLKTNKKSLDYKVLLPKSFSNNKEHPNRCVLLKKIDKNQGEVCDFGDFYTFDESKLVTFYKVNPVFIDIFCVSLFSVFSSIRGGEMLQGKNFYLIQRNSEYHL